PMVLSVINRVVFKTCRIQSLTRHHGPPASHEGRRVIFMLASVDRAKNRQNPLTVLGRLNGSMKIRTLIVDDQLLARELLRRLLKDEADVDIIGMPVSGLEA